MPCTVYKRESEASNLGRESTQPVLQLGHQAQLASCPTRTTHAASACSHLDWTNVKADGRVPRCALHHCRRIVELAAHPSTGCGHVAEPQRSWCQGIATQGLLGAPTGACQWGPARRLHKQRVLRQLPARGGERSRSPRKLARHSAALWRLPPGLLQHSHASCVSSPQERVLSCNGPVRLHDLEQLGSVIKVPKVLLVSQAQLAVTHSASPLLPGRSSCRADQHRLSTRVDNRVHNRKTRESRGRDPASHFCPGPAPPHCEKPGAAGHVAAMRQELIHSSAVCRSGGHT